MRINTRRTRAGLLILLAMGLMGAAWRSGAMPQPLAALSRDGALQTQWRRIMALRIPAGESSGNASTSSRSRPSPFRSPARS